MKSQKHNEGELKKLEVEIEKEIVEAFENMTANTGIPLAELVVVALKRFRSHHCDYEDKNPE